MKGMHILLLVVVLGFPYSSAAPQSQAEVTRQVNNKGVRINYRVYGKGQPLVLIHGWPSESRFWKTFGYVEKLSPDYQLIVPDMRGFGESATPADGNVSDAARASDIRAVMDDMGIKSADFFGFSVGGVAGYEVAASSPERVRSLIVLNNTPYAMNNQATRDKWSSAEANRRFWEIDNKVPLPEESRRRLLAWTPEQLRTALPDNDDKTERLKKAWKGPGLLIIGSKEERPDLVKQFIANSPNWKLFTLEGLTRGQVWIRSDLVLPLVQNFLRSSARSK